jgi:hypothetical protein
MLALVRTRDGFDLLVRVELLCQSGVRVTTSAISIPGISRSDKQYAWPLYLREEPDVLVRARPGLGGGPRGDWCLYRDLTTADWAVSSCSQLVQIQRASEPLRHNLPTISPSIRLQSILLFNFSTVMAVSFRAGQKKGKCVHFGTARNRRLRENRCHRSDWRTLGMHVSSNGVKHHANNDLIVLRGLGTADLHHSSAICQDQCEADPRVSQATDARRRHPSQDTSHRTTSPHVALLPRG